MWKRLFQSKTKRRAEIMARPFPAEWASIIRKHAPYAESLNDGEQRRLEEHMLVFLDEKHFEGCGGLTLTDEMRVTITAHACLPLINRETDYYPGLVSVLVYPDTFLAPEETEQPDGTILGEPDPRDGESWDRGAVIVAWERFLARYEEPVPNNVILHEFAHQLDLENGEIDGAPMLDDNGQYEEWARVCRREFERLTAAAEHGEETLLDPYGAEEPSEFFAVLVETFFEAPVALRDEHPSLYRIMSKYLRQDPASRLTTE